MPRKSVALVVGAPLVGTLTLPALAQNPFADVPPDHWAFDAIARLKAAGIIEGYPDGTFGGERVFTRYEMAMVVARMLARLEALIGEEVAAGFQDQVKAAKDAIAADVRDRVLAELADRIQSEVQQEVAQAAQALPERVVERVIEPQVTERVVERQPIERPFELTPEAEAVIRDLVTKLVSQAVAEEIAKGQAAPGAQQTAEEAQARAAAANVAASEAAAAAQGAQEAADKAAATAEEALASARAAQSGVAELSSRVDDQERRLRELALAQQAAQGDQSALQKLIDEKVAELGERIGATESTLEELRSYNALQDERLAVANARIDGTNRALDDLRWLVDSHSEQLANDIAVLTGEFRNELNVLGVRVGQLETLFRQLEGRVAKLEEQQAQTSAELQGHLAEHEKVKVSGSLDSSLTHIAVDNTAADAWRDPRNLDSDGDGLVDKSDDNTSNGVATPDQKDTFVPETTLTNTLDLALTLRPRDGVTVTTGLAGEIKTDLAGSNGTDVKLEPYVDLTTTGIVRSLHVGKLDPEAVASRFDVFTLDTKRLADELDKAVGGPNIDGTDHDHKSQTLRGATWELQIGDINTQDTLAWLNPGEYLFAKDLTAPLGPVNLGVRYVSQFDVNPPNDKWPLNDPNANPPVVPGGGTSTVAQLRADGDFGTFRVGGTIAKDYTNDDTAATLDLGADFGMVTGSVNYTRVGAGYAPFLARDWDETKGDVEPDHRRVLIQGEADLLSLGLSLGYSTTTQDSTDQLTDRAFLIAGKMSLPTVLPLTLSGEFGRETTPSNPQLEHTKFRVGVEDYPLGSLLTLGASYEWVKNPIKDGIWYNRGNWDPDAGNDDDKATQGRIAVGAKPAPGLDLSLSYTVDTLDDGGNGTKDEQFGTTEAGVSYELDVMGATVSAEYKYKNKEDLLTGALSWAKPVNSFGAQVSTGLLGGTVTLGAKRVSGHNPEYDNVDDFGVDTVNQVVTVDTYFNVGLEYPVSQGASLWLKAQRVISELESPVPALSLTPSTYNYTADEVVAGLSLNF